MFRAGLFYLFLFFSFLTPRGFSDPSVDVSLSKNKIKFEETSTLTVQIQWPKSEGSYSFALPELPLANLSLANQAESQESFLKGDQEWTRKTFTFELAPQQAGEGVLESFVIGYVNPNSSEPGQLQVSGFKLKIGKPMMAGHLSGLLFVLIGVVFTVLGTVFILLKKRKKAPKAGEEMSTQDRVLGDIKKRIQDASVFSDHALNDINREFRGFLKEVYSLDTARSSEPEILERLKEKNLLSEELRTVEKILTQIREAKFTGQRLSDLDLQMLKKEIITLIDGKHVHTFSSSSIN